MGVPKVAAAILAGGKSTRMGTNKAVLLFKGKPLVFWVYQALSEVFDEVFVVGPPCIGEVLGVESFPDVKNDEKTSSMRGIYTGLIASPTLYTFFAACDTPFLSPVVLRQMRKQLGDCDVFVPRREDYWQPLHAFYSKNCLPVIEEQMKNKDFKILNFYDKVNTCTIDMDHLECLEPNLPLFFNINTQDELKWAINVPEKHKTKLE